MEKIINCPACSTHMDKFKVSGVVVDVCKKGCGGIWFDKNELENFDESDENSKLLSLQTATKEVDYNMDRICPICPNTKMNKIDFASFHKFQVEACPSCGGVFLDRNELSKMRDNADFLKRKFDVSDYEYEHKGVGLFSKLIDPIIEIIME